MSRYKNLLNQTTTGTSNPTKYVLLFYKFMNIRRIYNSCNVEKFILFDKFYIYATMIFLYFISVKFILGYVIRDQNVPK